MPMRIIVTEAGPESLLTLEGELDLGAVTQLRSVVHQALLRGGRSVVLDLSGVTFLDSAGLWELIFCRNLVDGVGGTLTVASRSAAVERLLRILDRDWVTEILWPELVTEPGPGGRSRPRTD